MNCVNCNKEKIFHLSKKICRKCYRKLPNIKNAEKLVTEKYRLNNRNIILINKKKYYQTNLELERKRRKDYEKDRIKRDINFKIRKNLRTRVKNAVKRNGNNIKISSIKIDINKVKSILESKFQKGMTWDNYGEWHIDHIKPLSLFDLTNDKELKEASDPSNLQPLWAEDNLRKGANYNVER